MPQLLFKTKNRDESHRKLEEILASGRHPRAHCQEDPNDNEPYTVWDPSDDPVAPVLTAIEQRLGMRVTGFRLENNGPFEHTDWATLGDVFTFVIGANNSGKSWALRALALLVNAPHAESVLSGTSPVLHLRFGADIAAARDLLAQNDGLWIPRPQDRSEADAASLFWDHLLRQQEFRLYRQYAGMGAGPYWYPEPPYLSANDWVRVSVGDRFRDEACDAMRVLNNESDRARGRFRFFDTRQTDFSQCTDHGTTTLESGGVNLATALARLQGNQPRYTEYMRLARRVLPDLEWISAETSNGAASLWSWLRPPSLAGNEPKIPLSQCGAGIGHVLAILYAAFHEQNGVLLIDEPQAYLHPSACRELVAVLRELRHRGHRYVIATHSTAMLSEALPVDIVAVNRNGSHSELVNITAETVQDALASLPIVGARWSDVFGPDRIVWVEGETEAACLPLVAQSLATGQRGVVFAPLRATGDLKAKKSERAILAFEVYQKVTAHISLAARVCTIVMDKEDLTADEMERLQSRLGRNLLFFPFRMYEDLLRDSDAIAAAICAELPHMEPAGVQLSVAALLDSRAGNSDSALVMGEVFAEASGQTLAYRKVEHGIRITRWLLRNRPPALSRLSQFLGELMGGTTDTTGTRGTRSTT